MPAPGILDEYATLFLATVDASQVPARAGASSEAEHTRPIRITIDAALAALARGGLALNRGRLNTLVKRSSAPGQ